MDGTWDREVLHESPDGAFRSAAIAIGSDNAIHKMVGESSDHDNAFFFRRLSADGSTLTQQQFLIESDATVRAIDIDFQSNAEPTMLLSMDDDDIQLLIPEGLEISTWDGGAIGGATDDIASLGIDGKDSPWAVFRPEGSEILESWPFAGDGDDDWDKWDTQTLSPAPASRPSFRLDDGYQPHLSYALEIGDWELTYGTMDDTNWEHHEVHGLTGPHRSRLVVDDQTPHIVVRTDEETLRYFTAE